MDAVAKVTQSCSQTRVANVRECPHFCHVCDAFAISCAGVMISAAGSADTFRCLLNRTFVQLYPHAKQYRADTFRSAEFAGIFEGDRVTYESLQHTRVTSKCFLPDRNCRECVYVEICKAHGTALFNCDEMCIIFGDFYFTTE